MQTIETLIIGTGPSAIQLALRLPEGSFLMIDKGSAVRDHNDQQNAPKGFGGAAMFSDGKKPKKPAGTEVWNLIDKPLLEASYAACKKELEDHGVEWGEEVSGSTTHDQWTFKHYECVYVPLEVRQKLMDEAWTKLKDACIMNAVVYEVQKQAHKEWPYFVSYEENGEFVNSKVIRCRNLVFATGRFATRNIQHPFPLRFLRTEIGVRIEAPSDDPCWESFVRTDSKFIRRKQHEEWRTFCQIRDGEVIESRFAGVTTRSGRSDVPSTGRSNIGFNYRNYNEADYVKFEALLKATPEAFDLSWDEFQSREVYTELLRGMCDFFPLMKGVQVDKLRILGPTIEGVGYYPVIDGNLKIPQENVWCIGDCTGVFRGWTPADVSGMYVAHQIFRDRTHKVLNRIRSDEAFSHTYPPRMTGKDGARALHEIHIFLAPLNPCKEEVDRFIKAVEEWNALHPNAEKHMKACLLALDFKDKGFVRVMQSSRYILSNEHSSEVVKECHADALFFTERGFDVYREKIEASAFGINGVPLTDEEAAKFPTKYFEFHIRVERDNSEDPVMTEDQEQYLVQVSKAFTAFLKTPVPLSYNVLKGDDGKQQKYLNVRMRACGLDVAKRAVDMIVDRINQKLKVVKTIHEYVWYDSWVGMDKNWID